MDVFSQQSTGTLDIPERLEHILWYITTEFAKGGGDDVYVLLSVGDVGAEYAAILPLDVGYYDGGILIDKALEEMLTIHPGIIARNLVVVVVNTEDRTADGLVVTADGNGGAVHVDYPTARVYEHLPEGPLVDRLIGCARMVWGKAWSPIVGEGECSK